jgi:DNA-binding transcriptional regulator YdaS (Cro superfamily)
MNAIMLLSAYLEQTGKTYSQFATEIGVEPTTVYRWIRGDRFPRKHLQDIAKATKGKVTANDFVPVAA